MIYDNFYILWDFICEGLLKMYAFMFVSDIILWFSLFVPSLPGFGIRVRLASQNVSSFCIPDEFV